MFMRKHSKKLMMLAATGIVAFPLAVNAASTTIDATARFLQTITLDNEVEMDFGTLEYTGTPGAPDTVILATNGDITGAGIFVSNTGQTGTPGSVDIVTGTIAENVVVTCSDTATLAHSTGATIQLNNIEVATTAGAAGTGTACDGVGVNGMIFALTGTDTLLFGGMLDGGITGGVWTDGTYATTIGLGAAIDVEVVYQ